MEHESRGSGIVLVLRRGLYPRGDEEWKQFLSASFSTPETTMGRVYVCVCGPVLPQWKHPLILTWES